jgi:hypothetical protein
MKRGTIEHPKTVMLMAQLRIPLNHTVGILEHLWHWTGRYAPQGDIGKYSDEQIAQAVAPEVKGLVRALVDAKWLDAAPLPFRLVVHGWKEHADQTCRKYLARHELPFVEDVIADGNEDNGGTMSGQCPKKRGPKGGGLTDRVTPHARATEPVPVPEPVPVEPPARFPDTFAGWIDALAAIPGYKKIKSPDKRVAAERSWMQSQALVKNLPDDVVQDAWQKFVAVSFEKPYPTPCSTWITFLEKRAPRDAGGTGGRFEQRPMTGAREVTGMATEVELDEGDALARAKG